MSLRNSFNPLVLVIELLLACSVSLRKKLLRAAAINAHMDAVKNAILTPWTSPCCKYKVSAIRAEGVPANDIIKYVRE